MKKLVSAIVAIVMLVSCFASMTIVSYAATADNPGEYVFTVVHTATTNQFRYKFVLLDTDSNSTSSRFFVLGAGNYGAGPIHKAGDNSFSWDPTDVDTLSGYLNNTWFNATGESTTNFATGSGTSKPNITLYTPVKTYIDRSHVWSMSDGDSITCGVSALSIEEYNTYKDKFGYNGESAADHATRNWFLRSKSTSATSPVKVVNRSNGSLTDASTTGTLGFRPCFWLGVDFFKNVKLDLANTGSAVVDTIKANYTRDELALAGYSEEELDSIFVTIDNTLTTTVAVSGIAKPGYTLSATTDALDEGVTVTYQWQQSEDGTFTDISGATASTYTLKNAQAEKNVRVKIRLSKENGSIVGPYAYSNAAQVAAALVPGAPDSNSNGGQEAINLTYRLTVPESEEGMSGMNETSRTYFLLDDTGSDDAKFLLIESAAVARLENNATQGVLYTDATTNNKFDPNVEGGLAYWLKNTYATGGSTASAPVKSILNENKLAPAFIPYLDTDHEWLTEGGCTQGPCVDDYVVKAPAAVLSVTELKQYRDRFGWAEGTEWESGTAESSMLRTPRQNSVSVRLVWRTNDNNGSATGGGIVANAATGTTGVIIRPAFWLSKDVFKNVKLDVKKMGDGVKEMLMNTYTKAELSAIYSEAQLTEIGFESVSVSDVLLSGIPTAGSELEVNYNYSNSNPEAAQNVKIQWMWSDNADNGYTAISGATAKTYVVDSAYVGKYIKAEVTPLDSVGNEGAAVMSNHLGQIGSSKPINVTNPVFAQDGANYKVSFAISNTGDTTPVYIIIAAYNKTNNIMTKVNPQLVQVANGTDTYSASLENFTPDANTIVRAFVWNNLTEIIPLY